MHAQTITLKKRPSPIKSSTTQAKKQRTTYCLRRHGQARPSRTKKQRNQQHISSYCSRLGCSVTNISHPHTSFHCIPAEPKPLHPKTKRAMYIKRRGGQVVLRKEVLHQYHFKRDVKGGNYKCCEEHEFKWVVKSVQLSWRGKSFSYNLICAKRRRAQINNVPQNKWFQRKCKQQKN